ncbi:MAG: TetR/AcrR family transcriptional regulator [Myxococcota bacterium]|nr:TetR/AcrR family transcriptional regulator [Myxococcota bacterium]
MSESRNPGQHAATAQGERNRRAILEAATTLFASQGVAATGIDAVCKRAGVAKTALYWHFGSKEGLLAQVVESVGSSWVEEIRKSAFLADDPAERLDRLIESWRALLEEQPHLLRLFLVVLLERSESAETRDALKRVWAQAERALIEGIETSIGAPLPGLDQLAHTMLMLLYGMLVKSLLEPEPVDLEPFFEEFRHTVLLAVGQRLGDPEGTTG